MNSLVPFINIFFINLNYTFFFFNLFLFICLYLTIYANYINYINIFNKKKCLSFTNYISSIFFVNHIFYAFNLNIFLDFFSDFFQNINLGLYFNILNTFNLVFIKVYSSLFFGMHVIYDFSNFLFSGSFVNCVFLFSNFLFYFFLFQKNYLVSSFFLLNSFRYRFLIKKKNLLKANINIIFLRKYFVQFFKNVNFLKNNTSKRCLKFLKYKLVFFFLFNFNYLKLIYKKNTILFHQSHIRFSKNYMYNKLKLLKNYLKKKNKKTNILIENKNALKSCVFVSSKNFFFSLHDLYVYRVSSIKSAIKNHIKFFLKPTRFLTKNYLFFLIYGFKNIKHILFYSFHNQRNSFKFYYTQHYTLKNFLNKILKDVRLSLNS